MNLELASSWLARDVVGFADIHQFAAQCRGQSREFADIFDHSHIEYEIPSSSPAMRG